MRRLTERGEHVQTIIDDMITLTTDLRLGTGMIRHFETG